MNSEDLNVVIAGIGIVFLCMILITLVLYLFPVVFGGKNKGNKNKKEDKVEKTEIKETNVAAAVKEEDDKELIAVITAAISSFFSSDAGIKFRVKSFKRIGDSSAWTKTSRLENLSE